MKTAIIAVGMCGAAMASAFSDVVPNGLSGVAGNGSFLLSSTAAAGRTYQLVIDSSQLTTFVGSNIDSIDFRLNESLTANYAGTSFTQFDVFLGAGVDPTARSTTFASNFTGTPTLVRSGALTWNPMSAVGSPVKPFVTQLTFTTPYFYSGGDLTLEMRYSGSAASGPTLDAVTSTGAGYNTAFGAGWAASSTATTASSSANANFFVMQFNGSAVPEPATMAALGLGVATLLRRRRSARKS